MSMWNNKIDIKDKYAKNMKNKNKTNLTGDYTGNIMLRIIKCIRTLSDT